MKKQYCKQSAFSLIELSIVLVVIGLLVAGISKGSTLVRESKIKSARMITQNSPVVKAKGLIMWLDATTQNAFERSGDEITTWYDVKPLSGSKRNAESSSLTNSENPKYDSSGIGNLPSVYFDGTNDVMDIDLSALRGSNNYTIFVVTKPSSAAARYIIGNYSGNFNFKGIQLKLNSPGSSVMDYIIDHGNGNGQASHSEEKEVSDILSLNQASIIAASYNDSVSTVNMYADSVTGVSKVFTAVTSPVFDSSSEHYLGAQRSGSSPNLEFYGNIGEIIVFNKSLGDSKVKSIMEYLSKKWNIELS